MIWKYFGLMFFIYKKNYNNNIFCWPFKACHCPTYKVCSSSNGGAVCVCPPGLTGEFCDISGMPLTFFLQMFILAYQWFFKRDSIHKIIFLCLLEIFSVVGKLVWYKCFHIPPSMQCNQINKLFLALKYEFFKKKCVCRKKWIVICVCILFYYIIYILSHRQIEAL